MKELLYDTTTLARIIIEREMSITKQQNFLNYVWQYEKEYLFLCHKYNKKKFLLDVMHEINYWKNKQVYDNEIKAVNGDLEAIGSECRYVEETEYYDLRSYFMGLRLRMTFLDNQDFVRMKLRTLLRDHGYKRRTSKLNAYLKHCMHFYHIETYIRGGERCDIEEIGLDDMITFRVLGNTRDMISSREIGFG